MKTITERNFMGSPVSLQLKFFTILAKSKSREDHCTVIRGLKALVPQLNDSQKAEAEKALWEARRKVINSL
jgi:hypothetical protein